MRVVLSARALADLNDIGNWIARDDPRRAATFVGELRGVCKRIGSMPYAFAVLEEVPEIRHRVYRRYRIFYSITSDAVRIVSIRHGSRGDFIKD